MSASPPIIAATAITKTFSTRSGTVEALGPVDLTVEPGEFVSIVGPSGCGKSTLVSILSGLVRPSSGEVKVMGEPVTKPLTNLGIVFQEDLLLPWRNVLKNVLLQAEIRRLPMDEYERRARRLLELVGLAGFESKLPGELSGGMRQRVAMCRALVHDPPLLLMDEPFGALDAMTRDQMNLDLEALASSTRKTTVFVTHSIAEAVFLSDRVVVMSPRPGRIQAVIDIDFPRPRRLSLRDSVEYSTHITHIRRLFQSMGLFQERGAQGAGAVAAL